jgi:hypothetical protein
MSAGYGLVFAVLAALSALVAALASGWPLVPFRIAGAAATISFLLVSIAYFGAGPRLLLKRRTGQRPAWAWLLHWPFFALTDFSYRLSMHLSREAAYAAVGSNLYLGRRLTTREAKSVSWVAVLDLAAEMPETGPLRELRSYRSFPVLDATAMTLAQLRDAVAWANRQCGPVYVHCALGHSRSALVVAAYLLDRGLASCPKEAVRQLRALRPGVRLNRAQWKVLNAFAEDVMRTSGTAGGAPGE